MNNRIEELVAKSNFKSIVLVGLGLHLYITFFELLQNGSMENIYDVSNRRAY